MNDFNISKDNDIVTVILPDKVDAHNYEDIQNEVFKYLKENTGLEELIFNLNETIYVSSAGLRMFSAVSKECKQQDINYKLINLRKDIMKMFQLTGYSSMYTIEAAE